MILQIYDGDLERTLAHYELVERIGAAAQADAQVAAVETDRGYAVEVAVPLKNNAWNIRLDHGNVIGFQVHVNGASTAS